MKKKFKSPVHAVCHALGAAVILISSSAQAQNLFVANGSYVTEITPGGVQSEFADLVYPSGLAFDSAGNLFVSSGDARPVLGDITPSGTSGSFTSGSLFWPVVPAINSAGDLFVAVGGGRSYGGSGIGNIYEFTPGGAQSTFASGLGNDPFGLAFNSAGNLFSVDGNSIYEYTPGGARSTFASGLNQPRGLAFNNSGDLFVTAGGSIYEYTPGGTQSTFASGLNDPFGWPSTTRATCLRLTVIPSMNSRRVARKAPLPPGCSAPRPISPLPPISIFSAISCPYRNLPLWDCWRLGPLRSWSAVATPCSPSPGKCNVFGFHPEKGSADASPQVLTCGRLGNGRACLALGKQQNFPGHWLYVSPLIFLPEFLPPPPGSPCLCSTSSPGL